MDVFEYREQLHRDIETEAASNYLNQTDVFISKITNILNTSEEFEDFVDADYEGVTRRKANMKIEGYAFDEIDMSYCLFISDYRGEYGLDSITSDQIKSSFKKIQYFIDECVRNQLYRELEESTQVYELAKDIFEKIKYITKFRFYLLTDAFNKQRVKNLKSEILHGKPVELNVFDINRIFDIVTSTTQKESIEILPYELGYNGISCVKAVDYVNVKSDVEIRMLYDGEEKQDIPENIITYKSYLAVVPGELLSKIYLEYGSRLLEGNVRSFLQVKGKVNKSIQNTIKNYPEMFFAYNNGIAATATELDTKLTHDGLVITRIKDLQIVNGGQTTASLANAVLTKKPNEIVDLQRLYVPMKISVLEHSMSEKIIPKIAEYSNSQNKVDASDFFSNHPFHIRMEEFSRKTPAPAIDGNQYQQYWFYERTRGQYNQGKMGLSNRELNNYKLKFPDTQIIKLVDLAKYMELYLCEPHIVSKGKQAIVREFASKIKTEWEKSNEKFNAYYFKRVVALAIIYQSIDKIIKQSHDYKYGQRRSYKANVIAYVMCIIFNYIKTHHRGKTLDFMRIWSEQKLYSEFEKQINTLWPEVYDFITDEGRSVTNVTEYCKTKQCWELAKERYWTIFSSFVYSLVDKESVKVKVEDEKSTQKLRNEVDSLRFVYEQGQSYWIKVYDWGSSRRLLSPVEQNILRMVIKMYDTGHMPTEKQMNVVIKAREKLIFEGMPRTFE